MSLIQKCKEARQLKLARDEAQAQFKSLDAQYKKLQEDIIEDMEHEGVDSMKVDGINFVPAETQYGQVQDRQAFVEWAKENDEELIEYKERGQLVNELVRERLDNGEELPPGLTFYVRQYVGQRSA